MKLVKKVKLVKKGFAWIVAIDGKQIAIETNTIQNSEAKTEAVIVKTGARWWNLSALERYKQNHKIIIVGSPTQLDRQAKCTANDNLPAFSLS